LLQPQPPTFGGVPTKYTQHVGPSSSLCSGAMARPASQFCCGCSLTFGVTFILLLNLIQNLFYIVTAFSNVVMKIPVFGPNMGLTAQTFNAAFCLLGLPFIFSGFWGAWTRMEGHVRLYLYYMIASISLDAVNTCLFLSSGDICDHMPRVLQKHGSAFACGFMRLGTIIGVLQLVIVQVYFAYTVWSLCEDYEATGGGPGLPELMKTANEHHQKRRYLAPHGDEHFGVAAGFPVAYGAFDSQNTGLGGSRLFGGTSHETNYPPVKL